jgi:hypothetical protein
MELQTFRDTTSTTETTSINEDHISDVLLDSTYSTEGINQGVFANSSSV